MSPRAADRLDAMVDPGANGRDVRRYRVRLGVVAPTPIQGETGRVGAPRLLGAARSEQKARVVALDRGPVGHVFPACHLPGDSGHYSATRIFVLKSAARRTGLDGEGLFGKVAEFVQAESEPARDLREHVEGRVRHLAALHQRNRAGVNGAVRVLEVEPFQLSQDFGPVREGSSARLQASQVLHLAASDLALAYLVPLESLRVRITETALTVDASVHLHSVHSSTPYRDERSAFWVYGSNKSLEIAVQTTVDMTWRCVE